METGITKIDGNKYGVLILLPEELRALKLRITLGDWRLSNAGHETTINILVTHVR